MITFPCASERGAPSACWLAGTPGWREAPWPWLAEFRSLNLPRSDRWPLAEKPPRLPASSRPDAFWPAGRIRVVLVAVDRPSCEQVADDGIGIDIGPVAVAV